MRFIFLILIFIFGISGCGVTIKDKVWNNISELREFVVYGKDDNMSITLMCGRREVDYKYDGFSTNLIPFGVITVKHNDSTNIKEGRYVLYVGTEKFEGLFEKNPYDSSFVSDIGKVVDKNNNISIDVYFNDIKTSMKLNSVDDDWDIETKDLVNILIKNRLKELKSLVINGEFQGEIFFKIIDDYDNFVSDFYYYISVIGRKDEKLSMLVSPLTGEILAENLINF